MADLISILSACGATEGEATDEYFQNTTLLLHGDGTNGAQNNTFLDSSTNNFTITRNGNTTQGSFSPFSKPDGRWGNYFDGNGDYLSIADNAALEIGASSFCMESWVYLNALPANNSRFTIFGKWGASLSYIFQIANNSGTMGLSLTYSTNGTSTADLTQTAAITTGAWYHVAVTRDSTTLRFFLDGVQQGSNQTVNATFFDNNQALEISRNAAANSNFINGYLSNARLVVGSAVYTSNFTPSTTPLTAITNTSLLTCQSNRFIDNSSNNFTITRNGDVRVTPFSPFPITTAYDPAVNGGSGYFDGSGDYLSVARNTAFIPTTGDFTVEMWIYPNSAQLSTLIGLIEAGTAADWAFESLANGKVSFFIGSTTQSNDSTATYSVGQWNHVMASRSGSTLYVGINGVANTSTATGSLNNSRSYPLTIGTDQDGDERPFSGYISGVRFVNGTALYTSTSYTVPTAPLTAITNTSLLCNFTNAGIFDNTGFNNLETVGDAQIDTSVKKYGTGAMKFDGNGDGLFRPFTQDLNFGTGNFTIEWWMYFNSKSGYQTIISFGYSPQVSTGWLIQTGNGDGKIIFYTQSAGATIASDTGSTVNTGEWYHMAVVRNSGTTTIYRNGTSVGSGADTTNYTATTANFYVGGGSNTAFNNFYFNGYIDDLRITKGIARYTANFTPPTAEFPNIGE